MSLGRILLVEDEAAIADMLQMVLSHAGYEVSVATSAQGADQAVSQALPTLVILDWMLPDQSGVALCQRWRAQARTRDLAVIMLTARAEESDQVQGLEAGADDYMTKPFSPKALVARVRAVLRRKAPQALNDEVVWGPLRLDPAQHRAWGNAPQGSTELKLGPTEFRLLHYLMRHADRVHSRSQLLDKVWGDHVFIEERTVDVHIKRLREALSPVGAEGLIETVRGSGYRLASAPSTSTRGG